MEERGDDDAGYHTGHHLGDESPIRVLSEIEQSDQVAQDQQR